MKTPDEIKESAGMCGKEWCCTECPYFMEKECVMNLLSDALVYIEQLESRVEQKNRVLTLEEVEAYCEEGGADATPLWYDEKANYVSRWMVIDLPKLAFGSTITVKCLVNSKFFVPTYGKEWRCWLRKPTETERRETQWEGDGHE